MEYDTSVQADYDSSLVNKIKSGQACCGTSLHFHEPSGTSIGSLYYAPFINILSFDLCLFHMQPGIIAGDEVKHNHKYMFSIHFSLLGVNVLPDFFK